MNKNFVGLDLVRFALAVYLMVFHTIHDYPQANALPFIELADLGGFATSSFFILSGFILTHLYVDKTREMRGGARSFLVKRLSNLYPIHWLGLFLFVLVSLASTRSAETFLLPTLTGGEQQVVQLSAAPAAFTWLLNVFMLQAWDARVSSINGPSWSLSCLLFFYLLFPILGPRFANMRRQGLALVSLWAVYLAPPITVVLLGMYGPRAVGTIEHNPLLRIPEFLSGCLLYSLYASGRLRWMTRTPLRKAAAIAFIVACFVVASHLVAIGPLSFHYIVHNGALLPAELALIALGADVAVPEWAHGISARLGNAALSIFAIHSAIFMVMSKALKLTASSESVLQCAVQFSACAAKAKTVTPAMTWYPLYLLLTVAASIVFQERCVVPVRSAIRRRLLKPERANGASASERPKPPKHSTVNNA
ncbi:acyltransferase family protein [Trinickia sp.]|uniref:acyltransferase family protein n=1 Tax=Trinickia sp. TaxID=2571163 RepID=UPI003F7FE200